MDRSVMYPAIGIFIATLAALFLYPFRSFSDNVFFLLLMPMWGFIIGTVVAKLMQK